MPEKMLGLSTESKTEATQPQQSGLQHQITTPDPLIRPSVTSSPHALGERKNEGSSLEGEKKSFPSIQDKKKLLKASLQRQFDTEKHVFFVIDEEGYSAKKEVTQICLTEDEHFFVAYVRPYHGYPSKEKLRTWGPVGFLTLYQIDYTPILRLRECDSIIIGSSPRPKLLNHFAFVGQLFTTITLDKDFKAVLTFYEFKTGKFKLIGCEQFSKNSAYYPSKIWPLPDGYFYLNRKDTSDNQFLRLCRFDNNHLTVISEISEAMTKRPPPYVDDTGRLYYVAVHDRFDGSWTANLKLNMVDYFSQNFKNPHTLFDFSTVGSIRNATGFGLFGATFSVLSYWNKVNLSLIIYKQVARSSYTIGERCPYEISVPPLYFSALALSFYQKRFPLFPEPLVRLVMDYAPQECRKTSFSSFLGALPEKQFQEKENTMKN